MLRKLKSYLDKKYTLISAYVILTAVIIFIIAYIIIRIDSIFSTLISFLKLFVKLLSPLFLGIAIAYVIDPLVVLFERGLRKIIKFKSEKSYRSLAVLLCFIVITAGIFILIATFVYSITKQISNVKVDDFVGLVTSQINSFSDSIKSVQDKLLKLNIESKILEQYASKLSSMLASFLKSFASNFALNTLNISSYATNFLIGLIISIYLLLDKNDFIRYVKKIIKAIFSEGMQIKIKEYWRDFHNIFSGYIRGTILDAVFMSIILSVTLSVIGIKFGVLIGIMAGLCNLIPYFGPIVAFAGTIFFGLINGQYSQVLMAVIALVIIQQIDGNVIGPKLIGNNVALKPVIILISVLIGAEVGGILGMVLAVPAAGLMKLFIKRYVNNKLLKKDELIN